MEKERRGRLPVRARDARDRKRPRWVAEELDGGGRHRPAHVVHDHLGNRQRKRLLRYERHGSALHGGHGEVVPVRLRPPDAEEERAGLHRARVVGEVGNGDAYVAHELPRGEHVREALERRADREGLVHLFRG